MKLDGLQEKLGYRFKNEQLLIQSMTHPSYMVHAGNEESSNQRLEFLGDAVLELIISEFLYLRFPHLREGKLTQMRSSLVKGTVLVDLANKFKLSKYIRVNVRSKYDSPRELPSSQEDALEALIGAIFLDSDFPNAKEIVLEWFAGLTDRLSELNYDHNPKGRLQELLQPKVGNHQIRYEVVKETGPSHSRKFEVELIIDEQTYGKGIGKSKKEAEVAAAREVLGNFETLDLTDA
tara:strand:+ start:2167 stop:2871 length:705 start_codon:yes stop_codon:yes gene_type:complete